MDLVSRYDGLLTIEGRPHARLVINGEPIDTSDPDALAELADNAKQACSQLLHERSVRAQRAARRINHHERNHGPHDPRR